MQEIPTSKYTLNGKNKDKCKTQHVDLLSCDEIQTEELNMTATYI